MPADARDAKGDPDATFRLPRPRRPGAQPAPAEPAGGRDAGTSAPPTPAAPPAGRLVAAAAALLALPETLRRTPTCPDPGRLRAQLLAEVARFEAAALAAGVVREQVVSARFVLCCFIDEAIADTPWGPEGGQPPLLAAFHDERAPGDKAMQLLERLGHDPLAHRELLELYYRALRLGFEGRYRGQAQGRVQLEALAARILEAIRPAPAGTDRLALNPQAVVQRPLDARPLLPLWWAPVLCGMVGVAVVVGLNIRGDAATSPVFKRLHAVVPALALAPDPALRARPRVAPLLQAELEAGRLQVRDEALRSVVTLPADALFAGGTARLQASQQALLARIAAALRDLPGSVAVIGHTDGAPTGSLQFPTSWHLTHARAQAVQAALAEAGVAASRLRAEGRADAEPVAAQDPAANRALNRRIEIELRLPRPED